MEQDKQARKETPIYNGLLMYFPDACAAVAQCSYIANEQHNPGTKMHWDRSKSGDELDALSRHLMEAGTTDDDGILHSTKIAWRAMSNLQKELERAGKATTVYNVQNGRKTKKRESGRTTKAT